MTLFPSRTLRARRTPSRGGLGTSARDGHMVPRHRPGLLGPMLLTGTFLITGCTGGNDVTPDEARESIAAFADETAAAVGGEWTVRSGPSVRSCTDGGRSGVGYVYIIDRLDTADPSADTATVDEHWQSQGLTTEPYETGGESPIPGVRAVGAPTTRIDFYADPREYTITAVSECAKGNAEELRGEE